MNACLDYGIMALGQRLLELLSKVSSIPMDFISVRGVLIVISSLEEIHHGTHTNNPDSFS